MVVLSELSLDFHLVDNWGEQMVRTMEFETAENLAGLLDYQ